MTELNLEKYEFSIFYETGVEQATWIYPEGSEYGKWNYMIVAPYDTHRSLTVNKQPMYIIYDCSHKIPEQIYIGLIPSDEFAHELFINLRMQCLPHVRREVNIKDILNKK